MNKTNKTKTLFCLLAQVAIIAGMVTYYFWTAEKTEPISESATTTTTTRGLITGIMCTEEHSSAVIDGEIVREGDTIHGVKVVKIYKDRVEFEKGSKRWAQHPQEQPTNVWAQKG
jgi:hypothetical protein